MDILQLSAPSGWKVSTVGESYMICNQFREPISATVREDMKGEYPYYGPTQIVDYLDHYHLEGTYALIGEDGDHFLKYASRSMTQLATGKFNVNNHAHIIRSTNECSVEWFYYFFMHTSIFPFLTRQGAGRYKLNKSALEQLPILIPPLTEQRKIAEILSTWDEAIDLTEQLIAAKQQRKQALMQRLLTGKARFPELTNSGKTQHTPYGALPVDWHYAPIAAVAKQVSDLNNDDLELPVLSCTKHEGLVDSLEYFGRQMFSDDLSKYKIVGRSQFAYATNHIEEGSIGYQDLYEAALISPMYTVFQADPEQVCDGFLYRVLKTEKYRQIFEINTNGSVNRRGSLRWNQFSKIAIPLPSLEEQQTIATTLDAFDQELDLHQQKLDALRRQKQGLMQQLLTGKIRVKV